MALAQTAPPGAPTWKSIDTPPSPPKIMPEHEPMIRHREAFEKLLRDPIRDSSGRIKHIVLLDDTEIANVKDKGASKIKVDKKAKPWHKQKTKELIAQIEDDFAIESETILSTLVEGMSIYLDDAKKNQLKKDKRIKSIEEERYFSFSGVVWDDQTNVSTNEVTPWGVRSMGGPFQICNAAYNGRLDDSPVFVLDSGVHRHVDLNVVRQEAVGNNALEGCYAHATMVAGVIGAMDGASRANVALASTGATASASSQYAANYPIASIINGDRRGRNANVDGAWHDANRNAFPDWVQINFPAAKTVDRLVLYSIQDNWTNPIEPSATTTFSLYGITSFSLQYWSGSSWVTVPGATVTGNNLVMRTVNFTPLTTTAMRVIIDGTPDGWSRLAEVEIFSTPQSAGVVGVRPGTPIHSIAAIPSNTTSLGCPSVAATQEIVSALELVKQRVSERCSLLTDCRPGITNLSSNAANIANLGSTGSPGVTFLAAVQALITPSGNYPGSVLIHSAGNQEIQDDQASFVLGLPSQSDGYLRVGAIDQNGQQVQTINDVRGFPNPGANFTGTYNGADFLDLSNDSGSNYGVNVDVWAPGRYVSSTTVGNARGTGSGTSFSAPHIAALAAKLRESVANFSTPGNLESLVRATLGTLSSKDKAGNQIRVSSIGAAAWAVQPTVEFRGRTDFVNYPSRQQIEYQVYADKAHSLKMQGIGSSAQGCSIDMSWNGVYPPQTWSGVVPTKHIVVNWSAPGISDWTMRCADAARPWTQNQATARISVLPAPPALEIRWYVNGENRTNPASALSVVRAPGAFLGFFTLRFEAFNADSCTVSGFTGGFNGASDGSKWPASLNDVARANPWYVNAPVSIYGHDWSTVGLISDKYSWVAYCRRTHPDGSLDEVYARTHVAVQ